MGPIATIVIVFCGLSLNVRSISFGAGSFDGVKEACSSVDSLTSADFSVSDGLEGSVGRSNNVLHVSVGERCGCCSALDLRVRREIHS